MKSSIHTDREYNYQRNAVQALMRDNRSVTEACELIQSWHIERWGEVDPRIANSHQRIQRELRHA